MKQLRTFLAASLLGILALTLTATTPGTTEAQYRNWGRYYTGYGSYNYPYYWNNWRAYQPYRAFNPYVRWGTNYGWYYGRNYPFYTGYRNYYWNWYRW